MAGREIIVRILGDASQFDKATKQATASAGKFDNVIKGIGQGIGQGFTNYAQQAGGAVVDFAKDSIAAASHLSETMAKSRQIFGDGTNAVVEWGRAAADSMGLSTRAALDAASGFAGLFKTVGISLGKATSMSQGLTQLGADLTSFFDSDMPTALAALKSGLSGESEPLRAFNVFLSETAVASKLAEMGIKKVGGQFTEAQKITARYALIMEQTKDAQGDFARTSDGLANSSRTLDGKLENLQARLGSGLTPAIATATQRAVGLMDVFDSDSPLTFDQRLKELADTANTLNPAMWAGNLAAGAFGKATEDATAAAAGMSSAIKDAAREHQFAAQAIIQTVNAADRIGSAAWRAATGVDKLGDEAAIANRKYHDLRDAFLDFVDAQADQHRTGEELKIQIKLTNLELAGQRRHLSDLMEIKKPTRDQREDILETRLAIIESEKSLIRLTGQLHTVDGVSLHEIIVETGKLKIGLDLAGDNALRLFKLMQKVNTVSGVGASYGYGGGGGQALASGGYGAGMTWVGEQGPELLNLPPGSYVNNNRDSMKMAGGGMTVVVNGNIYGPSGVDELMDMMAKRLKMDGV